MSIKKMRITNFKSFKELEVELGKFDVLIGSNASGKSNFISIFEFLRDIENYGLDNAISMQGDIEYFRNVNIGSSMDFLVEVLSDQKVGFAVPMEKGKELLGIKTYETTYRFSLEFYKRKASFKIGEDKLWLKCEFVRLERQKEELKEKEKLGEGEFSLINDKGKIKYDFEIPNEVTIKKGELLPTLLIKEKLSPKTLLIETPFFHMPFYVASIFQGISIYNFDPKLSKKATTITGKTELEADGSNLAIVLKNIIKDQEKKRRFSNLIRDILSFVDDLGVEKFADKSLLVKLRETYSKDKFLPASSLSDGTINITALIIALYFERKSLVIVEEPDRNIHPYLISKVIDMMKEMSQKRQIIATTHNPEMVKHANLENILLISRNNEGFSKISRPCEKKEVKTFLENEMKIEELYVQNLLEL